MKIFDLEQIKKSIDIAKDFAELLASQKSAFMDFSSGLYDVPLPMQFIFSQFGSDCHIKGGYKQGSQNLVIKIVNGSRFGNNGIILVFAVDNGEIKVILHDQGFLTTLRTAIAGIIVTELMPWECQSIGIIGSGNLAAWLYHLAALQYPQVNVLLYARNKLKAKSITQSVCDSVDDLLAKCDVIFTTTSGLAPIIHDIPKGVNKAIIALGSDDEHKSELSAHLFAQVDAVIVDSKVQAAQFGDVARALKSRIIAQDELIEVGALLRSGVMQNAQTIIADFSGISAQDVAITELTLFRLL